MSSEVDLGGAEVFVRVVEAKGFSAAARQLGLPKSAVSRRVSKLEAALGVRLLQRTTRNLALTDAGEAFYERASRGLEALREAATAAIERQGAARGVVKMTAPVDMGVSFLAEALASFARVEPAIRVELELSTRLVDLVAEGFDLALRAGRLRDSSLIARRLGDLAGVVVASPSYLARKPAPSSVADLARHEAVLFRARDGRSKWQLSGPSGDEAVEVKGPIAADDFSFVLRAAVAGAGVALVPYPLCFAEIERGSLVRLLPDHLTPGGELHLVWPSSRNLPRRVSLLRDFLVESYTCPSAPRGPSSSGAEAEGRGRRQGVA